MKRTMKVSDRYFLFLLAFLALSLLAMLGFLRIRVALAAKAEIALVNGDLERVVFSEQQQRFLDAGNAFRAMVVKGKYDIVIEKGEQFELWLPVKGVEFELSDEEFILPSYFDERLKKLHYKVRVVLPSSWSNFKIVASAKGNLVLDNIQLTDLSLNLSYLDVQGLGAVSNSLSLTSNLRATVDFTETEPIDIIEVAMSSSSKAFLNSNGLIRGSVTSNAILEYDGDATIEVLERNGGLVQPLENRN